MRKMKYRQERKHEIGYGDLLVLRQRLQAIAKYDRHTTDGKYEVRSLYFDNISDKALREKTDGVNNREKFRIRFYNRDASMIRLEKKSKTGGFCRKESVLLNREQTQAIVEGGFDWMIQSKEPLLCELYSKIMSQGLRPKTIVDYTREPFVFAPGNVRVTLDYNIRTGLLDIDFLNPKSITVPAGNAPVILEVKWDHYLPDVIRDAVQLKNSRVGSFSKYAACRIYS